MTGFFGDLANTLTQLLNSEGFAAIDCLSKEYVHHLFSSALGFLRNSVGRRNAVRKVNECENQSDTKDNETGDVMTVVARSVKAAIAKSPYIMSALLFPVLRPYGVAVERSLRGHELIVVARPEPTRLQASRVVR